MIIRKKLHQFWTKSWQLFKCPRPLCADWKTTRWRGAPSSKQFFQPFTCPEFCPTVCLVCLVELALLHLMCFSGKGARCVPNHPTHPRCPGLAQPANKLQCVFDSIHRVHFPECGAVCGGSGSWAGVRINLVVLPLELLSVRSLTRCRLFCTETKMFPLGFQTKDDITNEASTIMRMLCVTPKCCSVGL